jgi:hypothetical protein
MPTTDTLFTALARARVRVRDLERRAAAARRTADLLHLRWMAARALAVPAPPSPTRPSNDTAPTG